MYGIIHERPEETPLHKTFYGIIMPVIMTILLLGVSSFVDRPKFHGLAIDLIIRIGLLIWYYVIYRNIANISTYSQLKEYRWSKEDVSSNEKPRYIGAGIFLGCMCGIFTWWMVKTFLPCGQIVPIVGSVVNALIVGVPLTTHYWIFKV